MKRLLFIFVMIMLFCVGCSNNKIDTTTNPIYDNSTDITDNTTNQNKDEIIMKLYVDNVLIDVEWIESESLTALKELLPLELTLTRYGGFEQVGSIGKSIKSNDSRITTSPGDIVLYNSNNIVMFYGTNTWSYTKLGHINLSNDELNNLLNKESVKIKLVKEGD